MILSAGTRKSISDLTRRRARAIFVVATLALAVASISIRAMPALLNRAMNAEVAASRLANVTITTKPLVLTAGQIRALGRLPNVTAFEPRSTFSTAVYIGARRQKAFLIGRASFAHQSVDVVTVSAGAAPGFGAALTDVENAAYGRSIGSAGGSVRLIAANGRVVSVPISGVARNLTGGQMVAQDGYVSLYASAQTVAVLSGTPGYSRLAFRLHDTSRAATDRTVTEIRHYLQTVPGFTGFSDLPQIRAPGDWPGKGTFDQLASVMDVVTLLALLCALVLLSSTMSTLVSEQTKEIAEMRAIGARRGQIRRLYLGTAGVFGVLGALVGAVLGIGVGYALAAYFASSLYAISAPFSVDVPVLVASIAVGLIGPPLAALPAIRRAARLPLAESLLATGSAPGRQGRLDRLVRRLRFLPPAAQIGVRSAASRKRRSAVTVLQVAAAVAMLLGGLALAASVTSTTQASWRSYRWDIAAGSMVNQLLPRSAGALIDSIQGVARSQPLLINNINYDGKYTQVWALPDRPMYQFHLISGRLFTAADERARARVVDIEQNIALATSAHAGEHIQLGTASGLARFTIIGIVSDQQNNGTVLFAPLTTMQAVLHDPRAVNYYWIQTTSADHALVDRTSTRLQDAFTAHGVQLTTQAEYVAEQADVAKYRGMTTVVTVLGLLIVAISMVGLANAITMTVLERTREIGIMRCVGAHAADVRRIFGTEGLTIALVGWLIGVPLGLGLARGIVKLTEDAINVRLLFTFPLIDIPIALAGTIILALLVVQMPLRRAVRFKPGEALRYA